MSSSTTPSTIKILHQWDVTITQDVDTTTTETLNGQPVTVTRKVPKPVVTRFGLRDLSRQERRHAGLFHDSRIAYYARPPHNLLLASELTNRLINTTGGVLTDKEKERVERLRARMVEIDMDIVRAAGDLDRKQKLQNELASIRGELINLNAINEEVYSRTAEAHAQGDLNHWITFQIIMVQRDGKWQPFFEGQGETLHETFDLRDEYLGKLDASKDPLYQAAVDKIATYTFWYGKGVNTTEAFALMDAELAAQDKARVATEAAATEAAKAADVAPVVEAETPVAATPTEAVA